MKTAVSNFTTIRPVGAALMHVDRRTDGRTYVTKLIGAFRCLCELDQKQKCSYNVAVQILRLHYMVTSTYLLLCDSYPKSA